MDRLMLNYFQDYSDEEVQPFHEYDDEQYNLTLELFGALKSKSSLEEIKEIFSKGAKPNCVDFDTPLFFLLENNSNIEIIEYICNIGADVNFRNNKENSLHCAIRNNSSSQIVKILISKGVDINAVDKQTPLHMILQNSEPNEYIIELLLKAGASVDAKDNNTPIHIAINNKISEKIIKLLLSHNPNIEVENEESYLTLALKQKRKELVEILLNHGIDIHRNRHKMSYLHFAIQRKCSLDIIKLLIKFGSDSNSKDDENSPLHFLFYYFPDKELFDFLLGCGSDPNCLNSQNALHLATQYPNNEYFINKLVDLNTEINIFDGMSSLHYLLKNHYSLDIVKKLLSVGFNPNCQDLNAPFHYLSMNNFDISYFELFLEYKADINLKNKETALMLALQNGTNTQKIEFFLNNGSQINETDGFTPLMHACTNKKISLEIIDILLKNGANINYKDYDLLPLNRAIQNNLNLKIIEKLIEAGSILNINSVHSPIFDAICCENSIQVVELLSKSGADINIINSGDTPLSLACEVESNILVIQKLLELGADVNKKPGEFSPLQILCKSDPTYEKIKLLLDYGAEFDPKAKENIMSDLVKINFTDLKTYQLLLSKGFDVNFIDGYSVLHYAVNNQDNDDLIKFLLNKGANPNWKDGQTPFHIACTRSASVVKLFLKAGAKVEESNSKITKFSIDMLSDYQILRLVLQAGFNPQIRFGLTPLHIASKRITDPRIVNELIRYKANINSRTKACSDNPNAKIPKILILSGANIFATNGISALDVCKTKRRQRNILLRYQSLHEDFHKLFTTKEFMDIKIRTVDKTIEAHDLILKFRLGNDYYSKAFEILKNFNYKTVEIFLECLYLGSVHDLKEEKIIREICSKIGMKNFPKIFTRNGLIEDLKRLFQDEKSKDFTILVGNEQIHVHKLILIARSDLFRGMFSVVKDNSNRVSDYSGKSFNSIQALIEFLYTDDLSEKLTVDEINELQDAKDYYQLNTHSMISKNIKDLLSKKIEKN
ncbi:ankyrin repeat-containing protein [Anaeramoeba ignava]|uniref:Ankyrin repeat-containing protein n=1 Tax=Anaeramoeba ignava TaxID=1746090 RepID=A0A9Q0LMI8_ANAIG|nr:ankyrin repeat-containing protein [Anaeramoeba ignava]